MKSDAKTSAREKKVLYTGIALAIAILVYWASAFFSPGDGESLAGKVETQESLLRRQKELIGREDFFKKRIEDAESDIEKIRGRLLPGNNATAAATELQRVLNDFADDSGVLINTKSNLPEQKIADSDSLVKISVRIAIDCQEESLVNFLAAIKNYDKFLKVEEIGIGTVLQQKQLVLRRGLSIVVVGYISVPPPEPEAKPGKDAAQAAASAARKAIG
ncbi:MAG: hypothetical protein LBJ21_05750 [Acidobacteriota bacterium]|jgi:type II secretory pathway component PulM|nr:hypothetical protein [Acidobacteriota bacterium]